MLADIEAAQMRSRRQPADEAIAELAAKLKEHMKPNMGLKEKSPAQIEYEMNQAWEDRERLKKAIQDSLKFAAKQSYDRYR